MIRITLLLVVVAVHVQAHVINDCCHPSTPPADNCCLAREKAPVKHQELVIYEPVRTVMIASTTPEPAYRPAPYKIHKPAPHHHVRKIVSESCTPGCQECPSECHAVTKKAEYREPEYEAVTPCSHPRCHQEPKVAEYQEPVYETVTPCSHPRCRQEPEVAEYNEPEVEVVSPCSHPHCGHRKPAHIVVEEPEVETVTTCSHPSCRQEPEVAEYNAPEIVSVTPCSHPHCRQTAEYREPEIETVTPCSHPQCHHESAHYVKAEPRSSCSHPHCAPHHKTEQIVIEEPEIVEEPSCHPHCAVETEVVYTRPKHTRPVHQVHKHHSHAKIVHALPSPSPTPCQAVCHSSVGCCQ